jgi:hypothetical protein
MEFLVPGLIDGFTTIAVVLFVFYLFLTDKFISAKTHEREINEVTKERDLWRDIAMKSTEQTDRLMKLNPEEELQHAIARDPIIDGLERRQGNPEM